MTVVCRVLLFLLIFAVRLTAGKVIQIDSDLQRPIVPAFFVFGDSVVDVGTNSLFPTLLRSNFKPYGSTFFGRPTGRFSNGRNYADFITEKLGLPMLEPYLKRTGRISHGVNYASAGSGLFRSTNLFQRVIPLPDQILQFNQTRFQLKKRHGAAGAGRLLSESLYLLNIGSNDIFAESPFNSTDAQDQFVSAMLLALENAIKALYVGGCRKLLIQAYGPFGCIPGVLAAFRVSDGKCVQPLNALSRALSSSVIQFRRKLNATFPELKVIVGKPYELLQSFINNGSGFTGGTTACCGSGAYNGVGQCGRPSDLIMNPPTNVCSNVEEYVFWDYYHLTERVYDLLADALWNGNSSVVEPQNLKTLLTSS